MVQEILFCLTLIGLQITAKKMTDIIDELAYLMEERNVDLAKAYELINGGKISKGIKKEINWEALTDEFIYDDLLAIVQNTIAADITFI